MDVKELDVPFQGREEFLEDFMNAWKAKRYSVFGIFGMRSVGKSRTVRKHIDDVQKIIIEENSHFKDVKIINVDMRFLKTSKHLHEQMCALLGILPDPSYDGQQNTWFQQIESHIRQFEDQFFIVVFDNCEDAMDIQSELKDIFLLFLDTLAKIRYNIHLYITSTTQILFTEIRNTYFYKTLELMTQLESKKLLRAVAKSINFGEHLDKLVELCGGLPMALLMVGSELEADEGMLKPEDMVELLTECRLRALSREFYPKEDRIADVYKEFILRLSEVFQQRLATMAFIPGTFTASHVKEILGKKSVDATKDLVLVPLKKKNFISYDSKTERFDIHGILRDCLSVYVCIKNMPAVRKRFCKTFAEVIKMISDMMSTADYTEALALFGLENPNLQKLLTEVMYTQHDTYDFFIEVASTCSILLENLMASESEKFYEGCLKITQQYGRHGDEAVVKISYGSLLTYTKGDTICGEKFYCQALDVLKSNPPCAKLAELHQKYGWNLYLQGRAEESISHLRSSMEIVQKLGQGRTNECLQTLTYLGIVHTFIGSFDEAKKYYHESLKQHMKNLEEENDERVRQKKKPLTENEVPAFGFIFDYLGVFYQQTGDDKQALDYHEKGLEINRQLKVPPRILPVSINHVAAYYALFKRCDEAVELLKEAELNLLRAVPPHEANLSLIYDTIGKVYNKMTNFSQAVIELEKSVRLREKLMDRSAMHAESILHLCQAKIGMKNYEAAKSLAQKVVSMKTDLAKNMPQNSFVSEALECLVEISLQSNEESCKQLLETFENLEKELQRLIDLNKTKGNDNLVQHYTERLQSVGAKVSVSMKDSPV